MRNAKLRNAEYDYCALAQMTNGAAITWTSTTYTNTGTKKENMGTGQFDQSGERVYAENVWGAGTTFDGITFHRALGKRRAVGGRSVPQQYRRQPGLASGRVA